jgi:uncharacterized damage-inducible protein DinB
MATPLPSTARAADELTTLREMLDYYRVVMIRKAEGLTTAQASERSTPTGLTLLTLIRHLTDVERGWFRDFGDADAPFLYCTDDDPDGDLHPGPDDTIEDALDAYRGEIVRSNELIAGRSLDEEIPDSGATVNLRWIMVHMIEETARHAGHADILRELTDGAVDD